MVMLPPFQVHPSWFEDYWYRTQPRRRFAPRFRLAVWIMLMSSGSTLLSYFHY
jgi:hypothetical protein